jgi:AcrR family transcriptional regulator
MGHPSSFSPRQEEILDIVESIFLAQGFRAIKMDDLVAAARCSRRTLYELASNKDQLFLLAIDRMWHHLGEQARQAADSSTDPAIQLEAFWCASVEIFRPGSATKFLEDVEAYGAARRLFDDHIAIALGYVAELVAVGIRQGHFIPTDPRLVAEVLMGAVYQIAANQYWEHHPGTIEAVRQAVRLILTGLTSRQTAVDRAGAPTTVVAPDAVAVVPPPWNRASPTGSRRRRPKGTAPS